MITGEAGRALIKEFENLKLEAYPDPGTGGEPITIGWGTTGIVVRESGQVVKIHLGMVCTESEADYWFDEDLAEFEDDVMALVKVPLNQNQFDALVSFTYNVGPDMDEDELAEGLGDSTLLKKLNAGDYAGAANEFPKWNRSGGQVLAGLKRRRAAEQALFLKEPP